MMRKNFGTKSWFYPLPVLIVGTYDENGLPDVMNAAWGGLYDADKVVLCLSAGHKTTANIKAKEAFTVSFAARACWRKLPAVHCSSCLRRNNSLRQSAPVLQSAFAVSAAQRLHRNANGLATIRRGSRTIYSRRAAQHSGRPVCRTVWDWQAA